MNSRLLWTIAGACLCLSLGGCGKDGITAQAAGAISPADWSCDTTAGGEKGKCDRMKIRNALPAGKDSQIIHLADGAKFRIEYDGRKYRLVPKSAEWAAALVRTELQWDAADSQLLDDAKCVLPAALKAAGGKTLAMVGDPKVNPHFHSGEVVIHNKVNPNDPNDYTMPEKNILYIYPIEGKKSYCLEFSEVDGDGGGLHDGAVHGDP